MKFQSDSYSKLLFRHKLIFYPTDISTFYNYESLPFLTYLRTHLFTAVRFGKS